MAVMAAGLGQGGAGKEKKNDKGTQYVWLLSKNLLFSEEKRSKKDFIRLMPFSSPGSNE